MLLETIPPIRNSLQPLGVDKQKNKKKRIESKNERTATQQLQTARRATKANKKRKE
jgi:hypothetical protein